MRKKGANKAQLLAEEERKKQAKLERAAEKAKLQKRLSELEAVVEE